MVSLLSPNLSFLLRRSITTKATMMPTTNTEAEAETAVLWKFYPLDLIYRHKMNFIILCVRSPAITVIDGLDSPLTVPFTHVDKSSVIPGCEQGFTISD